MRRDKSEISMVFIRSSPLNITPAIGRYVRVLREFGFRGRIVGIQIVQDNIRGKREQVEVDELNTFFGRWGSRLEKGITLVAWQPYQLVKLATIMPDVVQYCDVFSALPALASKWLFGTKLVFDIRDNIGARERRLSTSVLGALERLAARHSDVLVIVRYARKVFLPEGVDDKLFVIPNTPLDEFEDAVAVPGDRVEVVINLSGYLGEIRNVEALCAAARSMPEIRLDVYGNVYGDRVKKALADAGHSEVKSITGAQSLQRMRAADLVAITYDSRIPINRYADPNKYYEALMLGKPVLCTKGMEIAEEVERYDCGFVVEYDSPPDIVRAARALQGRREEFSRNARRLYDEKYKSTYRKRAYEMYAKLGLATNRVG